MSRASRCHVAGHPNVLTTLPVHGETPNCRCQEEVGESAANAGDLTEAGGGLPPSPSHFCISSASCCFACSFRARRRAAIDPARAAPPTTASVSVSNLRLFAITASSPSYLESIVKPFSQTARFLVRAGFPLARDLGYHVIGIGVGDPCGGSGLDGGLVVGFGIRLRATRTGNLSLEGNQASLNCGLRPCAGTHRRMGVPRLSGSAHKYRSTACMTRSTLQRAGRHSCHQPMSNTARPDPCENHLLNALPTDE